MTSNRLTPAGAASALTLAVGAALFAMSCPSCSPSPEVPAPAPSSPPAAPQDLPTTPGPYFTDMTASSGLAFTYRNGEEADHYSILESLGGGVALIDYDQDGLLDVFVPGGGYFAGPDRKEVRGHRHRLFRNEGGWKLRDVTAHGGPPTAGLLYS